MMIDLIACGIKFARQPMRAHLYDLLRSYREEEMSTKAINEAIDRAEKTANLELWRQLKANEITPAAFNRKRDKLSKRAQWIRWLQTLDQDKQIEELFRGEE